MAPRRPLLVIVVFLAGLAAGAALAYRPVEDQPGLQPHPRTRAGHRPESSGIVSLTNVEQVQADERKGYQRYAAGVAGLVLAFLVVLLVSRGLPGLLL